MGYRIKVQKVERPTNRSYYLNLPVVLAEAMGVQKGDELEWFLEDKNTLVLESGASRGRIHQKSAKSGLSTEKFCSSRPILMKAGSGGEWF